MPESGGCPHGARRRDPARCLPPISHCAIWVSVMTAHADDTVVIQQHPGAAIDPLPPTWTPINKVG